MKKKFRWVYVYVGWWECYITDKKLKEPATLVSKHKTVWNAEQFIEKNYPSAYIVIDKDIWDLCEWAWWMTDEDIENSLLFYDLTDKMEVA